MSLLPLTLFAAATITYVRAHQIHNLLWFCNVSNLVLGLGLLLRVRTVTWVGALSIMYGSAWWLANGLLTAQFDMLPVLTHVATSITGAASVFMLRHENHTLPRQYLACGALFLLLQGAARVMTPGLANVNFAFEPYYALWPWYPEHYAWFWLVFCAFGLATLYLLERGLLRLVSRGLYIRRHD